MKVKSITYGRTFNDGNFESTRIDISADLDIQDTVEETFIILHETVIELRDKQLDYVQPPPTPKGRPRR